MSERVVERHYCDPLDVIWLKAASRLGMEVVRSDEVFASWDGKATLTLATPEHFDADDCLAQLICHEICHAIIESPDGLAKADWGLENIDDRDVLREYATIRLQTALSGAYGLRQFFAVTTEWRRYFDALPEDPLGAGSDPAIAIARDGWGRARAEPWRSALDDAFRATAAIAELVRDIAPAHCTWAADD